MTKQASVTQPIEPYVDTETVAQHLGKPESWIYNRGSELQIPRYLIGRIYRYKLSEIEAWVRNGAGS